MQLDENQRQQVATWVSDGVKLSDIQNRIAANFGVQLTYMDLRFLVSDLAVIPPSPPPPPAAPLPPPPPAPLPAMPSPFGGPKPAGTVGGIPGIPGLPGMPSLGGEPAGFGPTGMGGMGQPMAPPQPVGGLDSAAPVGSVQVGVDKVTRVGALASGTVAFSDGQTGTWYLDQSGRLGVAPTVKGYKPSQPDVLEFQRVLDAELARLGY